ncbi:hypothetical protein ABK040_011740 [Willaertia magna]
MSLTKFTDIVIAGRSFSLEGLNDKEILSTGLEQIDYVSTSIPFAVNKIIAGGAFKYEYNCIWTKEDKIYLLTSQPISIRDYVSYFRDVKNEFNAYEIDFKKAIAEVNNNEENLNLEIKEIIGNANSLFLWMKNDHLYNFQFGGGPFISGCKQTKADKKVISIVGTGPMSERFYFVEEETSNCYLNEGCDESTLVNDVFSSDISLIGCCKSEYLSNKFTLDVLVTKDNNLYCKFGGDKFIHKPFNFTSKVTQLKCGNSHVALLLANNDLYYFDTTIVEQQQRKGNLNPPKFVKELLKLNVNCSPVIDMLCSSLHTEIVTKEELILVRKPDFDEEPEVKRKKFKDTVKLRKCSGIDVLIDYHIAVGPWHRILYTKQSISKGLELLSTNLMKLIHSNIFNDIDFL